MRLTFKSDQPKSFSKLTPQSILFIYSFLFFVHPYLVLYLLCRNIVVKFYHFPQFGSPFFFIRSNIPKCIKINGTIPSPNTETYQKGQMPPTQTFFENKDAETKI